MAKKSDGPVAKSAEQIVAAALRTSAVNLVNQAKAFAEAAAAQAEALNALAEMYEGSSPKREPATPGEKTVQAVKDATDAGVQITATKEAALALINADGNRDRVNAIITKHAGELKPLAELDGKTLKAIADDCAAALKAPKPAAADDL